MSNVGPIQTFTNLTNLKNISDITRFLTAFTSQVGMQFNNLLSNRFISGAVSSTGTVVAGANYGVSFVSAGSYYIKFSPAYTQRPSVIVSSETATSAYPNGVTTIGFSVTAAANTAFSFICRGDN